MPLYRETLASYRTRFLRVVKDANQQYFNAGAAPGTAASYADIDAWINEAIRWRDLWSGGSRAYKHEQALKVGFDEYDLTTMFPAETILDIPYIWVIVGNDVTVENVEMAGAKVPDGNGAGVPRAARCGLRRVGRPTPSGGSPKDLGRHPKIARRRKGAGRLRPLSARQASR